MSVNTKINGQLVPSAGLYKKSTPMSVATCYSEDEHKIGVWIDGKPLYQKTYNVTFSSDAYAITIPSEIDIKTIIGGVDSANKTDFIHIGYGGGSSDSVQAYRTDATTLRFQNKYYSQRPNGEITIQYTKTTDNVTVSTYAPIVPMNIASKYSTEEKVVGQFVDGKPLYQITKKLTQDITMTANTWATTELSASGIEKILNCELINSLGTSLTVSIGISNGYIVLNSPRALTAVASENWWLTYFYTKTTDTANTGLYSDDEATLGMLGDVDIDESTLTDGQVLVYNGTTKKWENRTLS